MVSSDGCGRLRWTVACRSLSAVTLSTLAYHDRRGFLRSLFSPLPISMSKVQTTSLAVNGLPSCQVTPSCSLKTRSLPSALQLHDLARSGTMPSGVFCGLCWSKITRLFITAMNGITVELVASSWIDPLGGLSRWNIFRTPPGFWARAAPVEQTRDVTSTPASIVDRIVSSQLRAAIKVATSFAGYSTLPLRGRQAQIGSAPQTGGIA